MHGEWLRAAAAAAARMELRGGRRLKSASKEERSLLEEREADSPCARAHTHAHTRRTVNWSTLKAFNERARGSYWCLIVLYIFTNIS